MANDAPVAMCPSLVIFDFDGTLADSAGWFARTLNGVARRYRFRETTRVDREAMRVKDAHAMLRCLGIARWKLPFIARHMRRLMARDIAEIRLFPGVSSMMEELDRAGISIAVLSSNAEANVRNVLGPALSARVDHFACGSALFGKAAKTRRLIRRCGVPRGAVLAVGDETRDAEAAERAGIAFAAVAWGYADAAALRARAPALMFATVEEITDALIGSQLPPHPTTREGAATAGATRFR